MKFTFDWLRDHLDTTVSLEQIVDRLSIIGLEVEGIDEPAKALSPFVVARVLEAKQHPNADKLRVLQVDMGAGAVEVVCGAPNARAGMIGVFAPLGSYIPGTGITLDKRPVRGVISNGMMVSERELELSNDHEGIIDLGDAHAKDVGKRYVDVMGLGDPVVEVKLTPNRPDCTGVRGIARDIAAAGLGKLKPPRQTPDVEGSFECPIEIKLDFPPELAKACPVFAGRLLRGIKNGASPAWMQQRLKAIGLRPISAVVDVTNYVSMDVGRPLHVYDADKIVGAIRARNGRNGESFLGLDGKTHKVEDGMCVIADDKHVLGFGGIMGGEESGSTHETTNVLIECAYFDPLITAATGRKAGLTTDARYRFERGVDPAFIAGGLDLGTRLMMDVAGGTPSRARVAGKEPVKKTVVSFAFSRVKKLAGLDIEEGEARKTLDALGFAVEGKGDTVQVTVPTWRPDVHGSADIVEEIVRIEGLDKVPSVAMPRVHGVTRAVLTDVQKRARRARRVLATRGFVEAITWSFIPRGWSETFGGGAEALELANPISTEMSSMRPSLLPGLLTAAQRNRNRGFADVALFEVGQVYKGDKPEDQLLLASGVRMGAAQLIGSGRHWDGAAKPADVFDIKADAAALLAALGVDPARAQITRDAPAWFHPGRSATLRLGPKVVLAQFGEVHPATLKALDVAGPVSAFEVFVSQLPAEKKKVSRARAPLVAGDLLPVTRDFAFLLDRKVAAGDVMKAAAAADKALISGIRVFDLFEGDAIGADKKSLAIEVTLSPTEKTLTDAEIEAVSKKVIAEVKKATGGEVRG